MMSEFPSELNVLSEHRQLMELFARIEGMLVRKIDREDLKPVVDVLKSTLLEHFQHEEADGFFARIVSHAPRFQQAVSDLQEQHRNMSSSLQEFSTLLRDNDWDATRYQFAANHFAELKIAFFQHEEEENALLQETYERDVGSKD